MPETREPTTPSRFSNRVIAVLILGLIAAVLVLAPPGPAEAARTGEVPRSVCARHDRGVHRGLCVADARGGVYWLGTLRGYDGIDLYCIDYAFATDWGVAHDRVPIVGTLPTSAGGHIGTATVAALNRVLAQHPATGVDDTTAAAIGLIIREVMGDVRRGGVQMIPGGLTASGQVSQVAFVPTAVLNRARVLWNDARVHRGPWQISIVVDAGADHKVTAGERVPVVVRGTNGPGRGQAMTVALTYRGFTGPQRLAVGADGVGRVVLTAPPAPAAAVVTARVERTPGTRPVLVRPRGWVSNPRPGHPSGVSQRGLLGSQGPVVATASVSTVVVRSSPTLHTEVSAQTVLPGATIHDTVTVSGTGGSAGTFFWSLLGPVRPRAGDSCPPSGDGAWTDAGVIASGVVATVGDGIFRTPDHTVTGDEVGCLTYVESRPETASTWPASSPPGLPTETVLVRRPPSTPCVSTVASAQEVRVDGRLSDRIRVGCITGPDQVLVRWTAYGPLAPRPGVSGKHGCDGISPGRWLPAPVAARGVVPVPRSGVFVTRSFVVRAPGCYTFAESVAATATTVATGTVPGAVSETTLVTRPPVVLVPQVPTGPDVAGVTAAWVEAVRMAISTALQRTVEPVAPGAPRAGILRIPALRVEAPIDGVGLSHGALVVPDAVSRLGWWQGSARAQDVVGSSVIAGHVSDRSDRPGALASLGRIRHGDRITWIDRGGVRHRFVVQSVARYRRTTGLPGSVFGNDGRHTLRLITCAGRVRTVGGGIHYRDNLVVTAVAVG